MAFVLPFLAVKGGPHREPTYEEYVAAAKVAGAVIPPDHNDVRPTRQGWTSVRTVPKNEDRLLSGVGMLQAAGNTVEP